MRFFEFKEKQINERTLGGFAVKTVHIADQELDEFAPPGDGDGGDDGFDDEMLKRLAAQWWNGDEDPRVERTLAAAGWEIGQDEGSYDNGGAFVVQAGDVNGNSYMSWPAEELEQGVAEGSLNEFAPDGFNGGDDGEEFNPRLAKMAYDEGVVKGVSLADGATLERAMAINDWDKHDGGIYKQHFAKGFKAGRMNKINHGNKQYNLNLKLMKDGSIRHGEQGVTEGHADQQRQIFKKNGHPVGEVGIDRESSPGNGQWYMKYYPTGDDFGGYDSMEAAVADLKHLVNQFKAEGVAEGSGPVTHRIALTVTDPNHPMASKRDETIQKTVRVPGEDPAKAINAAIAHYRRKGYKVHDHHYMGTVDNKSTIDEAIKLNAPQRRIDRDELQGYADRIKTGTKTKKEKLAPIIHGSNIKAITKDSGEEWDLDDLARQITTRPRAILGTNAKMEKSATEGEIVYDLTLPALSGIVVDEESGDFVEITTCPGAGGCQLFCYARKGGYVMFPASSMSAAQALNFLVNDPEGYTAVVNKEINSIKGKTDKRNIQLVVRWHDAGDFFSKEYLDLAYGVANANPDVKFYAYTKMADVATGNSPKNFIINFSSGAKRGQEKKVEIHKAQGNAVKQGLTLPKDMFRGLFVTDAKGKYVKDEKGRTQVKGDAEWNQFKQNLASTYKIDPDTIITYDQMLTIPEGPKPKWNVVIFPAGHGDRAANRLDVENSFLMFH